jgi:hypothetical protein
MPKVMIEVDIPKGRSIAEAEGAVKRAFDPDWMASWWHISDIHTQANIMEGIDSDESEEITDDEAREVLRLMNKYHDSEVGINWDVIDSWVDHVKAQRHQEDCPATDGFGCQCKEVA